MKVSASLFIVTLALGLFLIKPSLSSPVNNTENIEEIHAVLDIIHDRIKDVLKEKTEQTNEALQVLEDQLDKEHSALKELQDGVMIKKAQAETEQSVALEDAAQEYAAKQQSIQDKFEAAMAEVQDLEQALVEKENSVSNFEDHVNEQKSAFEKQLDRFTQSLKAELALVDRIRAILDKMHSREFMQIGQPCDSTFRCLPGHSCVEKTCRASAGGECSEHSHCVWNNCVNGKCSSPNFLLSDGFSGSTGSSSHCWRGSFFTVDREVVVKGLYGGATSTNYYGVAIFEVSGSTITSVVVSTNINRTGRGNLFSVPETQLKPGQKYLLGAGSRQSGSGSIYTVSNVNVNKLIEQTPIASFETGRGSFGCRTPPSDLIGNSGGTGTYIPDLGIQFTEDSL